MTGFMAIVSLLVLWGLVIMTVVVNAWIPMTTTTTTTSSSSSSSSSNNGSRRNGRHHPIRHHNHDQLVTLSALTAPSYDNNINSDNNNNNSHDISPTFGGRILEGGKVIDFSSVKASGKAETALAQARQLILQQQQQQHTTTTDSSNQQHLYFANEEGTLPAADAILGINQDVIDQVGHELGRFCSAAEVQACAAYLRSQAPLGLLFSASDATSTRIDPSYDPSNVARYDAIIAQAYTEAGEVTSAFAKTFYMGTMLMSEEARRAIWAVYVWCRRTDEIVDAPRDNNDEMLMDLSRWEMRLEQLWQSGTVVDVYDLCLLHTRIQYPTMDIQPFMDMIRGMLMDVPDLGTERYENFDELHLYCYRVAGTVGVMSLPVFGCAPGYNEDVAREPALSLGVAFQLTNILRDVGEDAKQRRRIYLPREDMKQFGVTEEQIFAQRVDENYRRMMKYQIARARMYYERARRGVFMLAEESRLPVQTSLDAYGRILDKIEENDYDSLTKRAYVDKWEKLSIIPFSWYRTTDASRTFPLPGDKPVDLTLA